MTIEIKHAEHHRQEVLNLLSAESLPVADLPEILINFLVAVEGDSVIGVAGLEMYDNYALLRSVAVAPAARGKGVAAALLDKIEILASANNVQNIYLLTETAKDYFEGKGYEHVARMDIPETIKTSAEFTHLCPESATAMQKSL